MCLSRHLSGFVSKDSMISISIFLHYITEPCCPSSPTLSKLPDKPAGELVPTCFILVPRERCPGLIRSFTVSQKASLCLSGDAACERDGQGVGQGYATIAPPGHSLAGVPYGAIEQPPMGCSIAPD